jgi:hypothetical protein
MEKKKKHIIVHLTVIDGEREHDYRIPLITKAKDIYFAALHYAAHFYPLDETPYHYKDDQKGLGKFYAFGGEIAFTTDYAKLRAGYIQTKLSGNPTVPPGTEGDLVPDDTSA